MDAFEILKQMHVEAKSAFQQLEQAAPDQRGRLWAKLRPELIAHEQMEERFVYGPAVAAGGSRDPQLAELHQRHERQVQEAGSAIEQIGLLDVTDAGFLAKVRQLQQALTQHIEMEETDFWPRIRQTWGAENLARAATQIEDSKAAAVAGASHG